MARVRILILGGTGEGFRLAERLHSAAEIDVITSMAGRTTAPKVPVGALRRGGFGGVDGLTAYLRAENIAAVIDATHPFAAQISQNAASATLHARIPVVHIVRKRWDRHAADTWLEVATMDEAVNALPRNAGMTFLTTGKTQLSYFAARSDVSFLARIVAPLGLYDDVGRLPPDLTFIHDKGPFDIEGERRLFKIHNIEWVVSKNSGGEAAYAKIVVARELGVPVIMVQRPPSPEGVCVSDATEAVAWLEERLCLRLPENEAIQ